jgi:nitronate monooxygenase
MNLWLPDPPPRRDRAAEAEARAVGLFALVPAIAARVSVPVIAARGVADARTLAAAVTLGASAVQIGAGLLRTPEAQAPWAAAHDGLAPEATVLTRAFSGRAGRAVATDYVRAAPTDRRRRPIRCSAASPPPCAPRRRRPATCSGCRPGPARARRWRRPSRPPLSSRAGGGRRRRYCRSGRYPAAT